jgi:hypothetical protein
MPIPPPPSSPGSSSHPAAEPRPYALPGQRETFQPFAAILAFVFPGAGHLYLGSPRRAALIALGILSLFFGGLLIGGIDVVDRTDNPINLFGRQIAGPWFIGQAFVGPLTFAVDHLHQTRFKVIDPATRLPRTAEPEIRNSAGDLVRPAEVRGPDGVARIGNPGDRPPASQSIGRMNELGTLFIAIAGMLNLIAILDAAFAARRRDTDRAVENARRLMQSGRTAQ